MTIFALDLPELNASYMSETTSNPVLASRKRRLIAFFIDLFLVSFPILALYFLFIIPDFEEIDPADQPIGLLLFLVFGALLSKEFKNGISGGKWITGLQVRDAQNPDMVPSRARLALRNIFLLLWPLEGLGAAFSKDKKRLGDVLAKTQVLKNPDSPARGWRFGALLSLIMVYSLSMILVVSFILRSSAAYEVAIAEIATNEEVLEATGGIVEFDQFPMGNINISNDYGEASLQIDVKGEQQDVLVSVGMIKAPGEDWQIQILLVSKKDY